MLLIPLHRRPTAANWPWVTSLLILLNVFVYFVGQRRDDTAFLDAQRRWEQSGLAQIEVPLYLMWQQQDSATVTPQAVDELAQSLRQQPQMGAMLFPMVQVDHRFLAALADGGVLAEARRALDPEHTWAQRRGEVDRALSQSLTWRMALRYDRIETKRLVGSMFLHGSLGHLAGNMLFLALLGLLVEGALGGLLFSALYLLAGVGSALCSIAWRSGDPGFGVGASGAIAGLMGAYCVLWGMRKVRFFYWFFVVFNYVRAPALVLLPLWLGWELWQLLRHEGSGIAFDAHAGGIVCGALLALGVRAVGWQREDFLAGEGAMPAHPGAPAARGGIVAEAGGASEAVLAAREAVRVQLGKMDWNAARQAATRLQAVDPASFEGRLLVWRAWATATGAPAQQHAAARAVLGAEPLRAEQCAERKRVWQDYLRTSGGRPQLPGAMLLRLGEWFARQGELTLGVSMLRVLAAAADCAPAAAAALLRIGILQLEHDPSKAVGVLDALQTGWPEAPETGTLRGLVIPR